MSDMTDPEIRYCQTEDNVSIAYFAVGEGTPVVWMPNMPFHHLQLDLRPGGTRRLMVENAPPFAELITYDSRMSGLSDRDVREPSLAAYQLDLEAVIKATGIERFVLLGGNQSTPIAISYAASHPEQVSHLCLTAPFARGGDIYRSPVAQSLQALRRQDWMVYTETSARVMIGWKDGDAASQLAAYMRECVTQEGARAIWAAVEAFDVTEELQRVSVPTLVVAVQGNTWVPIDLSRRVAAGIAGSSLILMEPAESGDEFTTRIARAVERFVLGTEEPPPVPGNASAAALAFRTVLFTDLVGHTEMMSRLGDERGREVLREHERVTREVLRAHGGTEVKTMGDGFMASFASVTKAVECAIALQKAFAEREGEPLSVRVGLNAGEPIEEDGDLFGATVILASRIAAHAGAGEILIPEPVRHLLSGKPFVYADRGEFVPKGFDDAVRVYEVRWRE